MGKHLKKIPSEVKNKHSDVEWRKIAGLRDILIHEYFGINVEIIIDVIENKLPLLQSQINKILKNTA